MFLIGGSSENSSHPFLIEFALFPNLEGCEEPSYKRLPHSVMHFQLGILLQKETK